MKVFLHIGMPKAGSSAIQGFLFDNNEVLKQNGFIFPLEYRWTQHSQNQNLLQTGNISIVMIDTSISDDEKVGIIMNVVEHYINEYNVILSWENFWRYSNRFEAIRLFKERVEASGNELFIIAYIRNQYDYIVSDYLEVCKRHKNTRTMSRFVRENYPDGILNSYGSLRAIETLVGYDKLIVRNFDECKTNLIPDFLNILGLQKIEFETETGIRNPSIDELTGLAMLILNDVQYIDTERLVRTYITDSIQLSEESRRRSIKKVIMPLYIQL